MKRLFSILCVSALVCAIGAACSEFSEPILPEQNVEQQAGSITLNEGSTRVLLSPGAVLSAAQADYFGDAEILGPDVWLTGAQTSFQIPPGIPSGVTFSNWEIDPADGYRLPVDFSNPTLNITFNEAKQYYTLHAWFTFQNGRAEIWKTVEVIQPSITGPGKPALNTNVSYSLSDGVALSGWTLTPGTFTPNPLPNTRSIAVKFTSYGTYTLTADFSLPGSTNYFARKTVTLTPPTPSIYTVRNGSGDNYARFIVSAPVNGATYQWELNGVALPSTYNFSLLPINDQGQLSSIAIIVDPGINMTSINQNGFATARCRAVANGITSDWSNLASIALP